MLPGILHIHAAKVLAPYRLELLFSDGTIGQADVSALLTGPAFEAVREPAMFARLRVDPICRTVVWPNGADLAPEALYALTQDPPPGGACSPPSPNRTRRSSPCWAASRT